MYIDANIVIRIITNDKPTLVAKALNKLNKLPQHSAIVTDYILTEVVFVLETIYEIERVNIATQLIVLLSNPVFTYNSSVVKQAFDIYASESGLSIVDCMLYANSQNSNKQLLTFDKKLLNFINKK